MEASGRFSSPGTSEETFGTSQGRPAPEKISVARLPVTTSSLFGRNEDIGFLEPAWANKDINVVTIAAWTGHFFERERWDSPVGVIGEGEALSPEDQVFILMQVPNRGVVSSSQQKSRRNRSRDDGVGRFLFVTGIDFVGPRLRVTCTLP
jgi:hypothetical protein